ncbi:MAG: MoaD family protein [Actinomycetota bacterium]|nr:MoaD family protein [Actinomycetota bacterium]
MAVVKYYASLRNVVGKKEEQIEVASLSELLQRLSQMYEGRLARHLKTTTVLVNGKNVIHLKGRRTPLGKDDIVSLFPPLGGG